MTYMGPFPLGMFHGYCFFPSRVMVTKPAQAAPLLPLFSQPLQSWSVPTGIHKLDTRRTWQGHGHAGTLSDTRMQ